MGESTVAEHQPETSNYGKLIKIKGTKRKLWQKV